MTTSVIQSRLYSTALGLVSPDGKAMSTNIAARYTPPTMVTGQPHLPSRNAPCGTHPRARATPDPITVRRKAR